MQNMEQSIAAVVLAFSRDEILKKLLEALKNQTRKPDEIIVIYQGSNNEIMNWTATQPNLVVIQQENLGSAGGFCRGIEESIRRGHGWTWIFDDDAIPQPTALEELTTRPYFGQAETAFLGSRIVDRAGVTYMSPGGSDSQAWYGSVLKDRCIEAVDACWLGLLLNSQAVYAAGLPIEEFFLWGEDREFVSRLVKQGKGYCAISSVIVHYQNETFDAFGEDFFKIKYYARNNVAQAKLGPGSFPIITYRVIRNALFFLKKIAKREIPVRVIPWIFRGMFLFWPRVRYLKQTDDMLSTKKNLREH